MAAQILATLMLLAPPSVEKADAAWSAARYPEAAELYAQAYAETGDIAYLYARAQAEQASGDCVAASATYEAFIATEPLPEAVDAAESALAECRAQLPEPEPEPKPEPEPEPEPEPASVAAPNATAHRPPRGIRPWYRDPAGAVLVAVGGAGLGAGVALTILARTQQAEAERATDVVRYGERNDRAVALSRASIPVLVVGGALAIGGAVRYGLLARRQRAATARVRIGPSLSIRF